jgi:hypothetical protein
MWRLFKPVSYHGFNNNNENCEISLSGRDKDGYAHPYLIWVKEGSAYRKHKWNHIRKTGKQGWKKN